MNRATTRGGGGLLSLAQPVEGEESWTTPARARERNFWPNLHARPVPPLSRRDSGFQGCRISGFRLSKLHRNRCRCPRFPPRRHKPTPVDTDACPGWSPTFSVSSQTTPDPVHLDPPPRPCFSCRTCLFFFLSLSPLPLLLYAQNCIDSS